MADFDSSLPIRTETAGDVDIFVSDATTPSQKLKVNADGSIDTNFAAGSSVQVTDGTEIIEVNADGSINVNFPSGAEIGITDGTDSLEINADGSVNATVSATDLDIRDLSAAQDNVAISDGTDTLEVNADGSINSVVSATDLDIRDLTAASDSVQANLFDEAGVAFSETNPLPVNVVEVSEGDEVSDYQTSAAVAKNASVNHDYTVTAAKTFIGEMAWISGSGKLKAELLVNGTSKFVGFNSTANPNIEIPLKKIITGAATQVIRLTITNRDNAQDVYSTLLGKEI